MRSAVVAAQGRRSFHLGVEFLVTERFSLMKENSSKLSLE